MCFQFSKTDGGRGQNSVTGEGYGWDRRLKEDAGLWKHSVA